MGVIVSQERRRNLRIRTAFEVLNAYPPLEGVALLSDLSARGACVEDTSARPEIGKTVQLSVRVSEREEPQLLVGKVVRHVENGFAVEFEKPEPLPDRLIGAELAAETPLEMPRPQTREQQVVKRAGLSPFREIAVQGCANTQWISGRICAPPTRSLLDHLNQGEAFVRVIDAVASHHPEAMAFIALRTDALDLIIPLDSAGAVTEQRVGRIGERPVKCLLPYAVIEGTIGVIGKIRVSDHLLRCNAFIAVRDCRIRLAKDLSAPRDLSHIAMALVNVRRVIGISDLAASPPPPEDPLPSAR
jgi:PilZ domain.